MSSDLYLDPRFTPMAAILSCTARSGLHLVFKLFQRYQQTWSSISAAEKLRDVLDQAKAKRKTSRQDVKQRNGRDRYRRVKQMNIS